MGFTKDYYLQIQEEISNNIQMVEDGDLSRLDCLVDMRLAKHDLETALEAIKEYETSKINEIAADASEYPDGYRGLKITEVKGRRLFDFKSIPQWKEAENLKKTIEDRFKNAFEGVQKGIVQVTEQDGEKYWIDENGEMQPFPVLNIGKSFLKIEEVRKPK